MSTKAALARAKAKVRTALVERTEKESLTDIARKAGVPYGWLQQLFYGNIGTPGWDKFTAIAKYLNVQLDEQTQS